MEKKIIAAIALSLGMAISAFAQTQSAQPATPATATEVKPQTPAAPYTPKIHKRQVHQQQRIAQGVKTGELNAKEAQHLENREAAIEHEKKMAKADGVVTPAERQKIIKKENRTSKAIYHQKHDNQTTQSK